MEKITSRAALQLHIQYLEVKQSEEWAILKSSIVTAREELRPLNMIKRTLKEMNSSSTDKNEILATVVGVTAGILSKTVLFGLPGAYTGTCSKIHFPGYLKNAQALADKGVDQIIFTGIKFISNFVSALNILEVEGF